jgi:hypothetical protein
MQCGAVTGSDRRGQWHSGSPLFNLELDQLIVGEAAFVQQLISVFGETCCA